MTSLLDELVKSPRFPEYVDQLQRLLAQERQRRERFYEELSEDSKAEFINGQVVLQSPASYRHITAVKLLPLLLHAHVERHRLGYVGSEKVLVVLPRNDYEPDICFFGRAKADQLRPDQLKFPAPDLIAEVLSPTTEKLDRGVKFEDYAANGVGEYWLIDPELEQVEQFMLREGRYWPEGTFADGQIQSAVVTGFKIPVRAIFDAQVNLRALRQLAQE